MTKNINGLTAQGETLSSPHSGSTKVRLSSMLTAHSEREGGA